MSNDHRRSPVPGPGAHPTEQDTVGSIVGVTVQP